MAINPITDRYSIRARTFEIGKDNSFDKKLILVSILYIEFKLLMKNAGLSRLSDTYRCHVPISLLCRAKATCTSSRLGLWILMESNHLYSVLCLTHKVRMTYSSICYSEPLCNIRVPSFRAANMFFLSSLNKVFSLQHINVIHLTCGEAPT